MKLFSEKSDKHSRQDRSQNKPAQKNEAASRPPQRVQRAAPPRQEPEQVAPKCSLRKRIIIIVAAVLAALLLLILAVGVYANGIETIYPRVSMEGSDLGGMTAADAAYALGKNPAFAVSDKELNVGLPAGCELIISVKDAGGFPSAPDAADFAVEYCHGKGFFKNGVTFVKCLIAGAKLEVGDSMQLNESYLKEKISEATKKVTTELMKTELEINDSEIIIVKGASSITVNEKELYDLVEKALNSADFSPLKYTPKAATGDEKIHEIDLQELYNTIITEPISSAYDPATKSATESQPGRSFDIPSAQKLWDAAGRGDRVVIPLILTQPELTKEKLSSMLFADLLAQKSTGLGGSSSARINNITKAAAAINGIVLNPGDEFSYNKALGKRTAAAGYQAAGAYSNGEVVSEIGGGICQVSSTLYYCSMVANLEITNRLCHYFGVSYLPAGLDATVSWPSPDFKFKNNSEYPVKIESYVDKKAYTVVVKIYGSNPEGIKVQLTSETWQTSDGFGAASYRWVYDRDGKLLHKTKEATSQYHNHKAPPKPSPSPSPSISPSPNPSPSTSPSPSPSPSPTLPTPPASGSDIVTTAGHYISLPVGQ
ncbi:MAG: VanW family protein [Oscillospiraceae bacterium]